MAGSAVECSEPAGRLDCLLTDRVRGASLAITVPRTADRGVTLADVLAACRDAGQATPPSRERPEDVSSCQARRFADSLFLLKDDGELGEPIPGLRFQTGGRECRLEDRLGGEKTATPLRIEIDRAECGYSRNWPAFLSRRWNLRARDYSRFVETVVELAFGHEARSVLQLDTPDRIRRFLGAVAARIHAAPYETYSRYLEPPTPFRSCDQTLDRILEGDGGNCAEKAMALYLVACAYGIPAELVLGGEEASGKFPFRALRSILDRRTFADEATRDSQRYWQHYAVLCRTSDLPDDDVFCDVAGSNIPFLFLDADRFGPYLSNDRRTPLPVTITLEPIPLYYHRLEGRQDLPLDLAFAMEHFIESIDLIHTVDNELGLIHTGDYWVGVLAYRGRREFGRILSDYERFVRRAGLDPGAVVGCADEFLPTRHPLFARFHDAYPAGAGRIRQADACLRARVAAVHPGAQLSYVVLSLANRRDPSPAGLNTVPAAGTLAK